ncbi:MAG: hypothetical protein JWL76_2179 [Thermoleophilia bacterium]|nr:hypothetical protein [Thermoleophilia bacterium]
MQLATINALPAATWTPLPDLIGDRSVPWQHKTLIETTASVAAASVVERYDRNGDGRLDARNEATVEDSWMYWANADGSQFSGYTRPEHLATVRTTRSISDLLAAAARVVGSDAQVGADVIGTVLAGFDTNHDGRLTLNDANGGSRLPNFFGDLTRTVGERVIAAERSVS